jgi:type III secretion protein C
MGVAMLCWAVQPASAAPIRWNESRFHYRADGIPLAVFLRDLLATQALAVNVDADVKGTVRGQFSDPAQKTFEKVMAAFGLVWFFDGNVVHVSSAADMREQLLPITPLTTAEVLSELDGLGLRDARFPLNFSKTALSASGPPQYLELVTAAVERLRQRALAMQRYDDVVIRIFPLRYALAQDTSYLIGGRAQVIPGIATLLRYMMAGSVSGKPGGVAAREEAADRPARALTGLRGQGLAGTSAGASARTDLDWQLQSGLSARRNENLVEERDAVGARSRVVADARTNSVVIYDVPAMMKHYADAIELLDKPQELVEIEATVIELSEGASEELGVDWRFQNGRGSGASFDLSSTMSTLAHPVALATLVSDAARTFTLRLQALQSADRARILSRPRILTLNNTEAVLGSQRARHVRVAGNQQVDLYPITTGLMLRVIPLIMHDDQGGRRVRLVIQIDDGAFNPEAETDGIPEANSNFIATQAVVGDGESLLIGGYRYQSSSSGKSKVPLLGDIPWLGGLFRTERTAADSRERLFLITPRLVPERVAQVSGLVQERAETLHREVRMPPEPAQSTGGLVPINPEEVRP